MPEVSVIIPVYNRARALQEAVASVLAQTWHDLEIVIVDDGGTEALPDMGDARIRVIRHDRNRGAGAARNTGVREAQGNWIAFLDSDDLWLPEKLEKQMERGGAGLVFCDALFRSTDRDVLRALPREADWKKLVERGHGLNPGSTLLMRKSVWDRVGPFNESLRRLEDWDWLLRACDAGVDFDNVEQPLAIIRVGAAPAVSAVDAAAATLRRKHGDRIKGPLLLEQAAVRFWQKDWAGFILHWLKAFFVSPVQASCFIIERLKRLIKGDAPRFFAVMEKSR